MCACWFGEKRVIVAVTSKMDEGDSCPSPLIVRVIVAKDSSAGWRELARAALAVSDTYAALPRAPGGGGGGGRRLATGDEMTAGGCGGGDGDGDGATAPCEESRSEGLSNLVLYVQSASTVYQSEQE